MKLSNYPHLVQKGILAEMETSNLFLMSFVSKNMKKLIKSSRTKRFKSISRIVYYYDITPKGIVNISVKPIFHCTGRWTRVAKANEYILKTVEHQEDAENDHFQLNIAGKRINFKICKKGYEDYCPVASFLPMNKESAIESIHNCLLNFFGDSFEYHWVAEDDKLFIPRLKNLSVCLRIGIGNLDKVWDNLPTFLVLKQIIGWMDNPFKPESNFYQTESISLNLNSKRLLEVLGYFQGRQAILTCSSLSDIRGLIEFVNRWKSGEAFQKLEYLEVLTSFGTDYEFRQTQILNAIGVKQIDERKTPPSHTVPRICGWRYFRPKTDPIISHTYVVRETDNRVASISIQQTTILFGVWNEAEEEFLAMVK